MITVTSGQLEAWVAMFLWPFLRIGACVMTAPIFGANFVPARYRIVLAGAVTLLVAPLLPQPSIEPFSPAGVIIAVQQILIGVVIGFVLQIIFDALAMGGQLLANSMGLSFAFNVDPLRGASTPVLAQLYMLLVTLTFLSLNGHLAVLETLVEGFRTLPIGTTGLGADGLWQVTSWGAQMFRGALMVALPGMTALLIVNLAFGVVSRAAPTLNLFAIGFPITLICGLAIVMLGLPMVQASFVDLMRESFTMLRMLMGGGP